MFHWGNSHKMPPPLVSKSGLKDGTVRTSSEGRYTDIEKDHFCCSYISWVFIILHRLKGTHLLSMPHHTLERNS